MAFPRFATFRSMRAGVDHYLRYVDEDVQEHGLVQFSEEHILSPKARFELEPSKTVPGLVNIRSCFNNKYWTLNNRRWIAATADEPNENQNMTFATLFEPTHVDSDRNQIRLKHVSTTCFLEVPSQDGIFFPYHEKCLNARYSIAGLSGGQVDILIIFDIESLLILPKQIAFKGDNDLYLGGTVILARRFLQFAFDDIGNERVGHEVFVNPDGSIRIWSNFFEAFWNRSNLWMWADSNDTTANNLDTVFWPVKVADNVIALRSAGNDHFCLRLDANGIVNCLSATTPTITKEACFRVEELVLSRSIYNVKFHLLNARIYQQDVLTMATVEAINRTQQPITKNLTMSYTDETSSSWNSGNSLSLGMSITMSAGIPFITKNEVEISTEFTGTYQWGGTQSTSTTTDATYSVVVPPMTMLKVSLLATRAACDVPFSYTQRDVLLSGEHAVNQLSDGIYTGVNSFNFYYDTEETKLEEIK